MRAILQRVSEARVQIDGETVGEIGRGLLVLLGVSKSDTAEQARWLADKIVSLRIFNDAPSPFPSPPGGEGRVRGAEGKMNRDVAEVEGAILVVSQFTLYGDCSKGRRPSFIDAAPPETAIPLYEEFINAIKAQGIPTATGRFGAMMQVALVNDGPVTLILDSK
jgi:D-tyrosyl-tRNA(Tyr) deacylase